VGLQMVLAGIKLQLSRPQPITILIAYEQDEAKITSVEHNSSSGNTLNLPHSPDHIKPPY
jgi:hypothetical protein